MQCRRCTVRCRRSVRFNAGGLSPPLDSMPALDANQCLHSIQCRRSVHAMPPLDLV